MKFYLIFVGDDDDKKYFETHENVYLMFDKKILFQTSNKKTAMKKLNKMKKMKKYKDKNLIIITDEYPYIIFFENGGNYVYNTYKKITEARETARELFEERRNDVTVGIKDYMKSDGSFEMSDADYNFNVKPLCGFYNE